MLKALALLTLVLGLVLVGGAVAYGENDYYIPAYWYDSVGNSFYNNLWTIQSWGWTDNSWYDTGDWYWDFGW